MSMPYLGSTRPRQQALLDSSTVSLKIRQQPAHALVTHCNKEKNRKPIDPPPIIQMEVSESMASDDWLVSPYLFMMASLLEGRTPDHNGHDTIVSGKNLIGQTSSSLHRLKDVNNKDGGFFVFGDISIRKEGFYRLRFNLFDQNKETSEVVWIKSIDSSPFEVQPSKKFQGLNESSHLSRTFSDQGVRLRLRKEQRTIGQKRGREETQDDSPLDDRHGGNYAYSTGASPAKRQRSSGGISIGTPGYSRQMNPSLGYPGNNMVSGGYGYGGQDHAMHHSHGLDNYGMPGQYADAYGMASHAMPHGLSGWPSHSQQGPSYAPTASSYGQSHGLPQSRAVQTPNLSYTNGAQPATDAFSGSGHTHMPTPESQTAPLGSGPASEPPYLLSGDEYGRSAHYGDAHSEQQPFTSDPALFGPSISRPTTAAQSVNDLRPTAMPVTRYPDPFADSQVPYPIQSLPDCFTTGSMQQSSLMTSTLNSEYPGTYSHDGRPDDLRTSIGTSQPGLTSGALERHDRNTMYPTTSQPYSQYL